MARRTIPSKCGGVEAFKVSAVLVPVKSGQAIRRATQMRGRHSPHLDLAGDLRRRAVRLHDCKVGMVAKAYVRDE